VLGAEAEREAAMRPRVFYVKARVLTPVIMADPVPIRVNVRSLWMPRPVGPSVVLWSGMRLSSKWGRAMLWNVTATMVLIVPMVIVPALCKGPDRKRQHDRQKTYTFVHLYLRREYVHEITRCMVPDESLARSYDKQGRCAQGRTWPGVFFLYFLDSDAGIVTRKLRPSHCRNASRLGPKSRTALLTSDQSRGHDGHFVGIWRFVEDSLVTLASLKRFKDTTNSAPHDLHLIESRSMSVSPRINSCVTSIARRLPRSSFALARTLAYGPQPENLIVIR